MNYTLGIIVASATSIVLYVLPLRYISAQGVGSLMSSTGYLLLVFLGPARYRVVKITHSCSKMVSQTTKNHKEQYSLSLFSPLLEGNSPTSNGLILKMNGGYNGGEQSAREVR
jgi:hypothetical protein